MSSSPKLWEKQNPLALGGSMTALQGDAVFSGVGGGAQPINPALPGEHFLNAEN